MRTASIIVAMLLLPFDLVRSQSQTTASVRAHRKANEANILRELADFLSIPNVASNISDIRRNAARLIEMMQQRGIQARTIEAGGPPSVFGELRVPGAARTIGLYAHFDGQPVDASKWASEPFKPTLRTATLEAGGKEIPLPKAGDSIDPEWRLYARSASDDKAPIIAMLAAIDALKASKIQLTSNLKFFFEGEEEAGSIHLEELIQKHKDLLAADVWLCADGPVHQSRRQAIFFGCRGIVSVDLTVYGSNRPLHSGHYGNWAPNPAMRLAKLLAGMKDDNGRVSIEGFYDDAEPLGEEERRAIREMPGSDLDLMKEYGFSRAEGGERTLAELINEPSLNVDGIRSEYVQREARTIIPSEATATLDLRLVKGIEPRRQVERLITHIKKQGYFIVSTEPDREARLKYPLIARVTVREGYRAARTSMSLPIAKKIIAAVEEATGQRPVLLPTLGGSGPLSIFDAATKIPQIGVPIVNHDNNQHASNENLRLQNLWDGIEIFAALISMK